MTGTTALTTRTTAAGGLTFSGQVNLAGTIANTGTGAGTTTISGGVGSNVTALTQSSATSALTVSTNPLNVSVGGTTLTNALGTRLLTVSGGIIGTGNLVLQNNSVLASGITLSTTSVNPVGTITNAGSGTGSVLISAVVGTNVTAIHVRKYAHNKLDLDHPALRSALAIPIRLHGLSIGAILGFGKQDGVFFSEEDESLANLLASQAAASIESSWLYQELRSTLNTTSMLYKLSVDVIQAEALSDAAELITTAANKLTNAKDTGIVLLTREGKIEAELEMDASGMRSHRNHPNDIINQAIQNGQSIIVPADAGSLACYPLSTPGGTYGALWVNIPESRGQNFANLQTLANQAAVALERSILLAESRRQAEALKEAYAELELTYDRTLTSLMSALDARDRETEGHSIRVSRLACMLAERLGLSSEHLKDLERGALLHDIGKIGISDTILHKPGKLTEEEWKTMRIHPDIGARIVEGIPFLKDTLYVIRYHHERWDGSGYPNGLQGKEIPTQARIFAVADVFDALTSKRSYRSRSSADDAVRYMQEQSGILFDPEIVEILTQLPYHELTEEERTPL